MPELGAGDYGSPRWSWEILDCAMPMTFDTYSNCAFQCKYCFSFFQRALGNAADDYLHHRVRSVDVERVKAIFTGKVKSQFAPYIAQRFVLQWGGLSDGFDWYERKFGKSLELLQFFRSIDYPISISTKATWINDPKDEASGPYIEVMTGAKNVHVKSSIITLDWAKGSQIENGVRSSEERFKMLERMNRLGVGATTVRFRPFVLGISADYPFTAKSARQLQDFMQRCKDAGILSVTTEFLCLESRSASVAKERFNQIGEVAGFGGNNALFNFYKQQSPGMSGLMRLNYDLKRPYMETMQEAAHTVGLAFYVSDAHHKEKSDAAGCCGLPKDGPLSQYNRGQFAEAILIARKRGSVHWGDIAHMADWLKTIPFNKAEGYNLGSTGNRANSMYLTMFDFMHNQWNDVKSLNSPARYFGGALAPAPEHDEEGNVVYLYNTPFIERAERVANAQELQMQLIARGEDMRADGADWGYVGMPVFVDARDWQEGEPLAVMQQLERWRVNSTVLAAPENVKALEQLGMPHDMVTVGRNENLEVALAIHGYASAWVLGHHIKEFLEYDLSTNRMKPCSARAWLSGWEAKTTEPDVPLPRTFASVKGAALLLNLRPQEEP